jgi:hypothetical protein
VKKTNKKLLPKFLFPFQYFKYKKLYLLLGYDFLFITTLILLGNFSGSITDKINSLGTGVFISILILGLIGIIYAMIKYYFYETLNQKRPYLMILWKHSVALIILFISSLVIVAIITQLIKKIFMTQYIDISQRVIAILIPIIAYIIFVNYHNYDKDKILKGLIKSIKTTFSNKIVKIIYTNLIFTIIIYLFYNLIVYGFKFIHLKIYDNVYLLNLLFERIGIVSIYLLLIIILTFNKLIIYNIKPEQIK